MAEVADILDRAADLLEKPGAWTQGCYARDMFDSKTRIEGDAVCWCTLGAIARITGQLPEDTTFSPSWAAADAVQKLVGATVAEWNDTPGRTQAEVVAALREAASAARGGKGS